MLEIVKSFLWHISPALTAVVLGSLLINRFFVRKANLANLVDTTCRTLDKIQQDCAEYWSQDYNKKDPRGMNALECRIKANLVRINGQVLLLGSKYSITLQNYPQLILELQDCCTGGNFESTLRTADKRRYFQIVNVVNRLSAELYKAKL